MPYLGVGGNAGPTYVSTRGGISSTNSAAEQQTAALTLPAGYCQLGTTMRLTFSGSVKTNALAPALTWRIRVGPTSLTGPVVCTVAQNIADLAGAVKGVFAEFYVGIWSIGATGSCFGSGMAWSPAGAAINDQIAGIVAVPANTTFDTTVANIVELTAQFSVSNANQTHYWTNLSAEIYAPDNLT